MLKLRTELERLREKLEAKNLEMAVLKSRVEIEAASRKRREWIAKLEVMSLLSRARAELHPGIENGQRLEPSPENLDRAWYLAKQALELDPLSADAHSTLGDVYSKVSPSYRDDAIAEYREALRLAKGDLEKANIHVSLGDFYKSENDFSKAIVEYRAAINLNPIDPWFYGVRWFLSSALYQKGQREEALHEVRELLKLLQSQPAEEQSEWRAIIQLTQMLIKDLEQR